MTTFYSPTGNAEMWEEKPDGYYTPEEWEQTKPTPTLDEVKAAKRTELMRIRDAIIDEGFAYGGFVYPIGPDIQVTLLMQFTASQALPAPSYAWKDTDGIYRDIGDVGAFGAFCTAAMLYGQSLFAWEEMLQTLVNRAETTEGVTAITWDTVPEEAV